MGSKPKGVKKPRPVPGMPQKLTKEVKDKIIDAIRCGVYIETAAAVAGITRQTFYNWLRRGKEEKSGKFRDFVKEVNIAFAEVTRNDMELIGLAGERDWKAAAWRIEKRDKLYRNTSGTSKIGSEDDPFIVFLKGVRDGSGSSNAERESGFSTVDGRERADGEI